MNAHTLVRKGFLLLVCAAAAALVAAPLTATAADAPAPPVLTSPKASAVVRSTFVVTGHVGPLVTEVSVSGATTSTVTLLAADSTGATFTAQVTVPYGRRVLSFRAGNGSEWSEPTTLVVWQLGKVKRDVRLVLVDKSDFMLYVIRWNTVVASYPIAIGMRGTPTPTGTRYLGRPSHAPNRAWGPFRMRQYRKVAVRVAYRVRVAGRVVTRHKIVHKYKGTSYYIHGTMWPSSIGTPASGGCIRMYNSNLRKFSHLTVRYELTILRP
jgi:lipoprotein-anchoring transpeptidase ErfK/SrfK